MKPTNSNISIDLTEECNLACSYCFTWAKSHKKRVLPKELGHKIIDHWLANGEPIENRPRELSFWGGEPLLEWELLQDLVYYTEKQKGDQNIVYGGTSNGVLYTPDKVEWCKEHNALMLISLDGPEEVHDANRCFKNGRGSWKVIDKNVREALKIAPNQMVRSSITVESADKFFDTVRYFVEDLGVENFSFSPVYEDDWTEEKFAGLREQFEKTIRYMIQRRKEDRPVAVKHFDSEANIAHSNEIPQLVNPCGAGNNYSGWSIDGVHFPCHRFNKHELSFEERIRSSVAIGYLDKDGNYIKLNEDFAKSFLTFKDEHSDTCLRCDILRKSACNGGCYAVNYDMTKDIHGIEKKQCDFNKLQREMGVLYKELLEKEKLPMPGTMDFVKHSCICYNMCYMENTEYEIIHANSQVNKSCLCYNASYNHPTYTPQARTLKEREDSNKPILDAVKKITAQVDPELAEKTYNILRSLK